MTLKTTRKERGIRTGMAYKVTTRLAAELVEHLIRDGVLAPGPNCSVMVGEEQKD